MGLGIIPFVPFLGADTPAQATVDWRTWTALGALAAGLGALVWYTAKQPREKGRWGTEGLGRPRRRRRRRR